LAISLEEEDGRILGEFARILRPNYPKAAIELDEMRLEEDGHRRQLIDVFRKKYGEEIPLVNREEIQGFVRRDTIFSIQPWDVERIRRYVALMELETQRFYMRAAATASDAELRQLLGDLAEAERNHEARSAMLSPDEQSSDEKHEESRIARQLFVLQIIQPGLVGLMDGSVSTLAPLFAAAFATHAPWPTFLVGVASSVGAGISMGFAEALSDDGSMTGRGQPLLRGIVCALMTFSGGIFHSLPFMIYWNFHVAMGLAIAVVVVELFLIAWIRNRYMHSPFWSTCIQVVVGGVLVFLAGVLIGSS
jgi:rubrerythrin